MDNTHPCHVRTKEWIREWRGIYRLAWFLYHAESQWVVWSLWSRNRREIVQGVVYSHETALSLHEMTDIMPAKILLTVPETFRRSATGLISSQESSMLLLRNRSKEATNTFIIPDANLNVVFCMKT